MENDNTITANNQEELTILDVEAELDETENEIIELDAVEVKDISVIDSRVVGFNYPLDKNPARTYISSLANTGKLPQESALRAASMIIAGIQPDVFPWHLLEYQHIVALRGKLQEKYAPATANRILVAVRRTCHEAFMLGYMKSEELTKINAVKPVNGTRLKKGKALSDSNLRDGVSKAELSKTSERDVAIICLLHGAGLRRAELVSLNIEDYDGSSVKVIGKFNKERKIPLTNGAKKALDSLISKLGRNTGPIFVRAYKGGTYSNERITGKSIAKIIEEKLDAKPHDLRRTYVTNLLDSGVDIATAANLVGHEDVNTTKKYDKRGEDAMKEAVIKIKDIF